MALDNTDQNILRALQRDGRLQNVELARQIGLSPSSCLRRVRLLEEAGIIQNYVAVLDGSKIGAGLSLFARIWFKTQEGETISHFTRAVADMPEVVECHLMAGDCDAILRIVTADLASYRRFHAEKLTQIESIRNIKTDVPIETTKLTHILPINPVD